MSAISDLFNAWCKEHGITHPPAIAAHAFEMEYLEGSNAAYTKVLEMTKTPPTAPTAERQDHLTQPHFSAKEA